MSDSLTSSKEEQLKKDKGNEHQEHNLWSFIKGKKKQNHVPSTADIKGKKLPVASNHNDCEFKGCGIQSKQSYGSGSFKMRIKLPSKDSAGVVTTFYMKYQLGFTRTIEELDTLHNQCNQRPQYGMEKLGQQKMERQKSIGQILHL
ncbi:hypothetical protein T459_15300 [Capsicum annuum]|uniref:GH16 domain-containing protein n=1 Tax=Capsicum annuum TaxID=4072 RepID=A0A2G2ZK31_CAPAN|nr:hypothetical protein T459_15300 [Capsicum annuum]